MADNPERGLYEKYRVQRTDGQEVGPCIVMEVRDPNTWTALLVWADTVEAAGYAALAADTRAMVAAASPVEVVEKGGSGTIKAIEVTDLTGKVIYRRGDDTLPDVGTWGDVAALVPTSIAGSSPEGSDRG